MEAGFVKGTLTGLKNIISYFFKWFSSFRILFIYKIQNYHLKLSSANFGAVVTVAATDVVCAFLTFLSILGKYYK
jgi:hypothetical protein